VNETKFALLKRAIAIGIEDLDNGRYQSYNSSNLMQLAKNISKRGKIRLKATKVRRRK